jgi:hypothetical protein
VATQRPFTLLPKLVAAPRDSTAARPKKKLIRRMGADHSQLYRRSFQVAFLVLNLVLGTKFYFWVRQFEAGVIDANLRRPPGVEGWLPIRA